MVFEKLSNAQPPDAEASPTNFREYILNRQARWKSLKQHPLNELSQAIDIPDGVAENILGMITDNLPTYVPEELRRKIRETHPKPIFAVGVLPDKRIFHADAGMVPNLIIPEGIGEEEERLAYRNGIILLDEIANDTLAQDVLRKLGSSHKWFQPVAAVLENRNPISTAYKSALTKAENAFGGKDNFESFRQSLIIAMLSGRNDMVNEQLRKIGYNNLQAFAIEMGRKARYTDAAIDLLNKIGSPRLVYTLAGGLVTTAFPGVINLPLAHTLPATVNALGATYNLEQILTRVDSPVTTAVNLLFLTLNSYWALRPGFAIPNVVIHEVCHYLAQDTNHFGLRQVEYRRM